MMQRVVALLQAALANPQVMQRVVGLLLAIGAFWCWWIIQRDPVPALAVFAEDQGRSVSGILARIAVLCFVSALLALLRPRWLPGFLRPSGNWFRPLVVSAAAASALLFLLYLGVWSIVPLIIDAALVWGVLGKGWDVATLVGPEDSTPRRRW